MTTPPVAPGHDIFPVYSLLENGPNGTVSGVVTQLDLTELAQQLAPRLADPDSEFVSTAIVPRPTPGPPTVGPHRYTIYVPHDDGARINVGAPHPQQSETGISAHTKTHISLGAYDAAHATFLTLGAAATTVGATTNKQTIGYALNTAGASNHIAQKAVTVTSATEGLNLKAHTDLDINSATEGVTLSAAKSISATAGGNVNIQAGIATPVQGTFWDAVGAVVLGGLDIAAFVAPAAGHRSPGAGATAGATTAGTSLVTGKDANFLTGIADSTAAKLRDQFLAKHSGTIDKVLAHAATVAGLVVSFQKAAKTPKPGTSAWETKSAWASAIIATAAEVLAIVSDVKGSSVPEAGAVNINAEKSIAITAKTTVAITGTGGVKISGFKTASMSGLLASMKAHGTASVFGGLGATLKSLAGDVGMTSDLKGATVSAKKDVKISSSTGKTTVGGELDTQLNSISAKTFVHGTKGAYIGAGKGDGFGVIAKTNALLVGCVTSADDFKGTAENKGQAVATFKKDSCRVSFDKNSYLSLIKTKAILKSDELLLSSNGKINIKGKFVNIN